MRVSTDSHTGCNSKCLRSTKISAVVLCGRGTKVVQPEYVEQKNPSDHRSVDAQDYLKMPTSDPGSADKG